MYLFHKYLLKLKDPNLVRIVKRRVWCYWVLYYTKHHILSTVYFASVNGELMEKYSTQNTTIYDFKNLKKNTDKYIENERDTI